MEDTFDDWMLIPLRYRIAEVGVFVAPTIDVMYHVFTDTLKISPDHALNTFVEGAIGGYLIGSLATGIRELYRSCREENRQPAATENRGEI